MDAVTPAIAKAQLEETITTLVNAWLHTQRARHGDMHEAEINKFLNLSLRTVYELAAKEVLKDLPAGTTPFIPKDKLLPILRPPEQVSAPKPAPPPPPPPPPLKDETNGKTFIEGWIYDQQGKFKVSGHLFTALNHLTYKDQRMVYMEDITQKRFLKETKNKWTWEEFVQVMKELGHSPVLVEPPADKI